MRFLHNYIDGRFVAGTREFSDLNPADGTTIATVTEASEELVDAAVNAARRALNGEWSLWGARVRAALLHKIADAIDARFDCFVKAEVEDTGKPVALAEQPFQGNSGGGSFDVSRNGSLVFRPSSGLRSGTLGWMDRTGSWESLGLTTPSSAESAAGISSSDKITGWSSPNMSPAATRNIRL